MECERHLASPSLVNSSGCHRRKVTPPGHREKTRDKFVIIFHLLSTTDIQMRSIHLRGRLVVG